MTKLKKNVSDLFSITTEHYLNAGDKGVAHFASILNCIISNVNNASISNLNQAYGLILYKGHQKDKNSDRSYRAISTCPFHAKALDLYLHHLHSSSWHSQTAPTQFMAPGVEIYLTR